MVPRYFYVPEDSLDREQNYPNSSPKKACEESGLFLWNQAMFILAQLLTGGLLHINELDPIRRYLPSYNRPRKGGRYSTFQVSFFFQKFICVLKSFCLIGNVMLILLLFHAFQAKPSIVSNLFIVTTVLVEFSSALLDFFHLLTHLFNEELALFLQLLRLIIPIWHCTCIPTSYKNLKVQI